MPGSAGRFGRVLMVGMEGIAFLPGGTGSWRRDALYLLRAKRDVVRLSCGFGVSRNLDVLRRHFVFRRRRFFVLPPEAVVDLEQHLLLPLGDTWVAEDGGRDV